MARWVIAALALTLACAAPAAAADDAKKPVGTWTKSEGGPTITFTIKADGLSIVLKGEGDLFSFRFKVEKDKLTISDLSAPKTDENARKLVEGDYEKSKEKKNF